MSLHPLGSSFSPSRSVPGSRRMSFPPPLPKAGFHSLAPARLTPPLSLGQPVVGSIRR